MNWRTLTAFLAVAASALVAAQAPPQPPVAVLYENARLIIGTAAPPIERGAFVVQNGAIRAIGPVGRVAVPSGTQRVDLAGKTVMPALVNVHVHIGYEGYATWQAKNHTPANVVDHLQRSAFYGTAATTSVGTSPIRADAARCRPTGWPGSCRQRRRGCCSCPGSRRPTAARTRCCGWRPTS